MRLAPLLPAVLLAVLVAGAPATARADYEETEHRLKAAGIDAPLRKRIHAAIDAAVAHLVAQQAKRGSFPARQYGHYPDGYTALVALALRHAGTPSARAAAERAADHLFQTARPRRGPTRSVYTAGLAAMLVMADGRHAEAAPAIVRGLVLGQRRRSGWWGYAAGQPGLAPSQSDFPNLSTSQFAALGLWAGARAGAQVPADTWRRHLDGLLACQTVSGSWPYLPAAARTVGGYPTGTFMGVANLLLAQEALRKHGALDAKRAKRLTVARLEALEALRRDGRAFLDQDWGHAAARRGQGRRPAVHYDYYALYALEKACLFAGLERLGPVPWYRAGAEHLLGLQQEDGSWGTAINTAFALLFLVRSSESYRPITPRPLDAPAAPKETPVTPRPQKR